MHNSQIKSPCLADLNDRERLQDSLEWEGYTDIKMKSDGNCQFRALADQIYKTSDSHKRVRQEIFKQLKSHPKFYKGLVEKMVFSEYVKNMSNNSVWGDEVTLRAAADVYGVKIVVFTSMKHTPSIVILPKSQKEPDRVIHLSYLAGIHFNSIYLNGDSGSYLSSDSTSMGLQRKKNKNKKKEKEKEKEEKEKRETKEKNDKKEKKEKKNNNNLHREFQYSDVTSILEQEDDHEYLQ